MPFQTFINLSKSGKISPNLITLLFSKALQAVVGIIMAITKATIIIQNDTEPKICYQFFAEWKNSQ